MFPDIFLKSLQKINPGISEQEIKRLLDEITLELDYEDLGRQFYKRLTTSSGIKLIDFQNFDQNSFHANPTSYL